MSDGVVVSSFGRLSPHEETFIMIIYIVVYKCCLSLLESSAGSRVAVRQGALL